MRPLLGIALLQLLFAAVPGASRAADRPNILWLTAEDMSPHLGCYGDQDARTPMIDALAGHAVRYTRAFATAPVCSPARSCLITGLYATSLGTQRLRSQFPIPADFQPFPALLRAAGYHCTNNVKTDYNVRDEAALVRAAWDESSPAAHWRSRRPGQPFFAVFNFMTTHQSRSSVWPTEQFIAEVASKLATDERHGPQSITLPPYYPDTAEARLAWARYHDCITLLDKQIGELLRQLAADGLDQDTIVFFFSDHGMGLPRGKRCLYDSGLRVPLLIRLPAKWQRLAPANPGETCDRLVSFVDFAPTVLSLCGVRPPGHLQGVPFLNSPVLGQETSPPRERAFAARDRVDEAFDVARSVRDERWLYIRNFLPHLSWMQPEAYSDGSSFRREFKRLAAAGQLDAGPQSYAAQRRAPEELYDTLADPHQLHNLAGDPRHRAVLEQMRGALRAWQLQTRDAGFFAEPQVWSNLKAGESVRELAHDDSRYPLARLLDAAQSVGDDNAAERQRQWLADRNEGVRYWAAVALAARRQFFPADREAARRALADDSAVVRIEAASALARHGDAEPALPVLIAALSDPSIEVVLHAARALELLGAVARPAHSAMRAAIASARQQESRGSEIAMFVRFSLEAALAP